MTRLQKTQSSGTGPTAGNGKFLRQDVEARAGAGRFMGSPRPFTGTGRDHKPARSLTPAQAVGRGFTLIEMLVVIAVIGLLAGLVLSVTGQAAVKMRLNRVRTELNQYETAIEAYKAKFGSYPPDHLVANAAGVKVVDPLHNQLFYELTGTTNTGAAFMSLVDQQPLNSSQLLAAFGVSGFANCSVQGAPPGESARNFLPSLATSQSALIQWPTPQVVVRILTVSVPWPLRNAKLPPPLPSNPQVNPVYYNSSSPTNSTTYDLWAQVPIGNRVYTLGNWNNFVPQ